MKSAYIMRGLPGSGKSTVASHLAGLTGTVHSTDDFFYHNGEYRFDPSKLEKHHQGNFLDFCDSLSQGISVVVCDNTNTRHQDYQRYIAAAQEAGYLVAVVTMPHPDPKTAAARSTHKVPLRDILHMMEHWEP